MNKYKLTIIYFIFVIAVYLDGESIGVSILFGFVGLFLLLIMITLFAIYNEDFTNGNN